MFNKRLDGVAVENLREMHRVVNAKRFELTQVKNNTMVVPRGKELVAQLEAVIGLLERARDEWLGQELARLGFAKDTKVTVNLKDGKITQL